MDIIALIVITTVIAAGGLWMASFDHRSGDNEVSIFPQTSFFILAA